MQLDRLKDMRTQWVAEHGDEVCSHPAWEKEYFGGADTGDQNCVRCGAEKSSAGDITEAKTFVEAIYRRN